MNKTCFYHYAPTKILFGHGMVERITSELGAGARPLLLFGERSAHVCGAAGALKTALSAFKTHECWGIEPNPQHSSCVRIAREARDHSADCIIAVGGGSVIDAAKYIAMAARLNDPGEAWNILTKKMHPPADPLPIGVVVTRSGTASEVNSAMVISRTSTREKLGFAHYRCAPRWAVIDVHYQRSLSRRACAQGLCDAFVHTLEQYLVGDDHEQVWLQDRQAEALLMTLRDLGHKLASSQCWDDNDLAMFAWAAPQALNGTLSRGVRGDWSTHELGHLVTAFIGMAHADTLTALLAANFRERFAIKKAKLARFGRTVWGIDHCATENALATAAIDATEAFFASLEAPTDLKSLSAAAAESLVGWVTDQLEQRGYALGEYADVDAKVARRIMFRAIG